MRTLGKITRENFVLYLKALHLSYYSCSYSNGAYLSLVKARDGLKLIVISLAAATSLFFFVFFFFSLTNNFSDLFNAPGGTWSIRILTDTKADIEVRETLENYTSRDGLAIAGTDNDSLVNALVLIENEESHRCHAKGRSRELLCTVFRTVGVRGPSAADWLEPRLCTYARGVLELVHDR